MLIKYNNFLVLKYFPEDEMGISFTANTNRFIYIVGRNWVSISFYFFISNIKIIGIIYFNGFNYAEILSLEFFYDEEVDEEKETPILTVSLKRKRKFSKAILNFKQSNRKLYYAH